MKRTLILQKVLIVLLLIVFLVMWVVWTNIFNTQQETIDSYSELVEKQREDMTEIEDMWVGEYRALEWENYYLQEDVEELTRQLNGKVLPTYQYTVEEVILLAKCVQCEAGFGRVQSQKNVTSVILNRVESSEFPDTIEEVIYQDDYGVKQFSVAWNGMVDNCELDPQTLVSVYEVLLFGKTLPDYVHYFYAESIIDGGSWITRLPVYDIVQGTVFAYSESAKGE